MKEMETGRTGYIALHRVWDYDNDDNVLSLIQSQMFNIQILNNLDNSKN